MYHSIDFFFIDPLTNEAGSKINTYDDWGLVASSRPTIAPAKPVTNIVKIFGANKFVNMSESITGYPTYESRTGSLEFIVLNSFNKPDAKRWIDIYNEVSEYLHGRELCMVLEDEPEYYYSGVFSVNEFSSGEYNSMLTIDYELQPYKMNRMLSDADWIWDTFNFENGVIPTNEFRDMNVTAAEGIELTDLAGKIGQMPVSPTIVVSNWTSDTPMNSKLIFHGEFTYKNGKVKKRDYILNRADMRNNPDDQTPTFDDEIVLPLFVMYDDCTLLRITTDDQTADITFSIRYREGRL